MLTRVPLRVAVVAAGLSTAFIFGCSDSTKTPAGPSAVAPSVSGAGAAATGSAMALTPKGTGDVIRIQSAISALMHAEATTMIASAR